MLLLAALGGVTAIPGWAGRQGGYFEGGGVRHHRKQIK